MTYIICALNDSSQKISYFSCIFNNNFIIFFFNIVLPKSFIWNYFVKCGATAKYKICQLDVKTVGNTTNLHFHINRSHPNIEMDLKTKDISRKKKTNGNVLYYSLVLLLNRYMVCINFSWK